MAKSANCPVSILPSSTATATAAKSLQLCPTLRLHRQQPTRLPHPWDSPRKNTGVSCHFLLQCMKVKSESEVAQSRPTLCNPMDCSPPDSSIYGIFQARVLEWGAIAFSPSSTEMEISAEHLTVWLKTTFPSLLCSEVWSCDYTTCVTERNPDLREPESFQIVTKQICPLIWMKHCF